MDVKISVVVPTYRRPMLLRQCLEALACQDFDRFGYEVIVVSDGPDQTSADVVAACVGLAHVRTVQLPSKKGPAAARNAGWKQAKGVLIAFTDDDCIPAPGWLTAMWKAYNREPAIAFSGKVIVPVSEKPTDFERNTQGLELAAFITANCACTRTALEQVKGFDEHFRMAWREDSDLEFKLLQNQIPIVRVEGAVVMHPVREAGWGVSIKEQKKGMFDALLYKKFPHLFRQKIRPNRPWNYYGIILFFFLMTAGLFLKIDWIAATGAVGWLALSVKFIVQRLSKTSSSFNHVIEMIVTSLAIPFLSVYWQIYGAFKFRVLFI